MKSACHEAKEISLRCPPSLSRSRQRMLSHLDDEWDEVSLGLCYMLGLPGLPHVMTGFLHGARFKRHGSGQREPSAPTDQYRYPLLGG
jgi:Na+(H+)/acetate symporter ActP